MYEVIFSEGYSSLKLSCEAMIPSLNKAWRIKFQGTFISVGNKTSWKKIGHAKVALRNSLSYKLERIRDLYRDAGTTYSEAHDLTEKLYQTFLKENFEFVEI